MQRRINKDEWLVVALTIAMITAGFIVVALRHGKSARLVMQAACIANLKQIDAAKCSMSLEQKIHSRERLDWDRIGLANYLKGMVLPVCPAGGTYDVGATVEELPRCSIAGHAVSQHVRMFRE